MRKLYNDIIYFVQNHVRPVAPSNAFPSSLALPPGSSMAGVYPKMGFNWSSTTSSSSLTIAEDDISDDSSARPKLFGVSLGKRPFYSVEKESPPSSGSRLKRKELGLNLGPPCPC